LLILLIKVKMKVIHQQDEATSSCLLTYGILKSSGWLCAIWSRCVAKVPHQTESQSKEFKVMVIVDIFWYLTLVVGSELLLFVKQSVHNCTWIEHGSGPGIAYYRFNNLARLKYC
jgi:hypothetical protein